MREEPCSNLRAFLGVTSSATHLFNPWPALPTIPLAGFFTGSGVANGPSSFVSLSLLSLPVGVPTGSASCSLGSPPLSPRDDVEPRHFCSHFFLVSFLYSMYVQIGLGVSLFVNVLLGVGIRLAD